MKFKVIVGQLVPHVTAIVVEADDPDIAGRIAVGQCFEHVPELVPDLEQGGRGQVFSFSVARPHEEVTYPGESHDDK